MLRNITIKKGQYIAFNKYEKKECLLNFEEKDVCAIMILKNEDKILFEYLTPNEYSETHQIISDKNSPIKGLLISSINYNYESIFEKIKKSFVNKASYLKYIHSKNIIDTMLFNSNGDIINLNSEISPLLENKDYKLLSDNWYKQ